MGQDQREVVDAEFEVKDRPRQDEAPDYLGGTALAQLTRAEIDQQIATAKMYPRLIGGKGGVLTEAKTLATMSAEIAESCIYTLPRGGKNITGPSVRLAELMLHSWGNARAGAAVVDRDENHVTCRGFCHDLQKNVMVAVEVKRKIRDKNGRPFNEDMVTMAGNAGNSIALRNAIFRVIPRAYINQVYDAARLTAIGDAKTIVDRRAACIARFQHYGVPIDRILLRVGKNSVEDIDLNDLETLVGLYGSIKEGDATPEEAFPYPKAPAEAAGTSRTEQVTQAMPGSGQQADRPAEAKPGGEAKGQKGRRPTPPEPGSHEVGGRPQPPSEAPAT